jgi:hypothetical protein
MPSSHRGLALLQMAMVQKIASARGELFAKVSIILVVDRFPVFSLESLDR